MIQQLCWITNFCRFCTAQTLIKTKRYQNTNVYVSRQHLHIKNEKVASCLFLRAPWFIMRADWQLGDIPQHLLLPACSVQTKETRVKAAHQLFFPLSSYFPLAYMLFNYENMQHWRPTADTKAFYEIGMITRHSLVIQFQWRSTGGMHVILKLQRHAASLPSVCLSASTFHWTLPKQKGRHSSSDTQHTANSKIANSISINAPVSYQPLPKSTHIKIKACFVLRLKTVSVNRELVSHSMCSPTMLLTPCYLNFHNR